MGNNGHCFSLREKKYMYIFSDFFCYCRIHKNMLMDLSKDIMMDLGITVIGDIIAILKHAKQVYRQVRSDSTCFMFWSNEMLKMDGPTCVGLYKQNNTGIAPLLLWTHSWGIDVFQSRCCHQQGSLTLSSLWLYITSVMCLPSSGHVQNGHRSHLLRTDQC